MDNLKGKVAFVTGGASGIGLGMTKAFLGAGMRVVVADVRAESLTTAAADLPSGSDVHFLQLDVTDRQAMAAAADETAKVFGEVHVLCNNAGVGVLGHIRLVTYDDWDWCLAVNLGGAVNGVQTFLPRMLAHGEPAHIVNTSSIGAVLPGPGGVPYLSAKAALIAMTEGLQYDLAGTVIGVSVLIPGPTQSNINRVADLRPDHFQDTGLRGVEARLNERPLFDSALDPVRTGEMVVEGIRRGQLYIPTHGEFKDAVAAHCKALVDAFPPTDIPPGTGFDPALIQRIDEIIVTPNPSAGS